MQCDASVQAAKRKRDAAAWTIFSTNQDQSETKQFLPVSRCQTFQMQKMLDVNLAHAIERLKIDWVPGYDLSRRLVYDLSCVVAHDAVAKLISCLSFSIALCKIVF